MKSKERIEQKYKKVSCPFCSSNNIIKRELKKLGRTQIWLSEQIGVSRQAVNLYVQGKSVPVRETLDKLLLVLEVKKKPQSLDDLVENE